MTRSQEETMPDSGDVLERVTVRPDCSLYRLRGPYAPSISSIFKMISFLIFIIPS